MFIRNRPESKSESRRRGATTVELPWWHPTAMTEVLSCGTYVLSQQGFWSSRIVRNFGVQELCEACGGAIRGSLRAGLAARSRLGTCPAFVRTSECDGDWRCRD